VKAYDVYRPSKDLPQIHNLLTTLDEHSNLVNFKFLMDDPWKWRTNLTGLVIRCATKQVSLIIKDQLSITVIFLIKYHK